GTSFRASLETGLPKYAVQGPRRNLIGELAGNRHGPGFLRMVKLSMIAGRPHMEPTVGFNQLDDLAYFHVISQPRRSAYLELAREATVEPQEELADFPQVAILFLVEVDLPVVECLAFRVLVGPAQHEAIQRRLLRAAHVHLFRVAPGRIGVAHEQVA